MQFFYIQKYMPTYKSEQYWHESALPLKKESEVINSDIDISTTDTES